jgi:starch-binding outer membrane protein, SusD/RagB family
MKKFLIIIFGLILLNACKKQLEVIPVNKADVENFYLNGVDADAGLTGCYNRVFSGGFLYDYIHYTNIASDDGKSNATNSATLTAFDVRDANYNAYDGNFTDGLWNSGFNAIAAINLMLEKVEAIPAEKFERPDRKIEILAEGKFLRGMSYFMLTTLYGKLPKITTFPNSVSSQATAVSRVDLPELYAFIESDLLAAESGCPLTFTLPAGTLANVSASYNKGRATKAAAKMMLSRFYLYTAPTINTNLAKSKIKAQEVIDLAIANPTLYSLMNGVTQADNWYAIFAGGQNTRESILESQGINTPGFPNYNGTQSFRYLSGAPANFGATNNLLSIFFSGANVDIRRQSNFSPVGTGPNFSSCYWFKYRTVNGADPDNYVFLRLAEAYFNLAEVDLETTGPSDAIVNTINQFRARAIGSHPAGTAIAPPAMPLHSIANYTTAQLRDSLRNERRREFAQEGIRWMDLRRYPSTYALQQISASTGTTITNADKLLFPIPLREFRVNPAMDQNPSFIQ